MKPLLLLIVVGCVVFGVILAVSRFPYLQLYFLWPIGLIGPLVAVGQFTWKNAPEVFDRNPDMPDSRSAGKTIPNKKPRTP